MACLINSDREAECREYYSINRDKTQEANYAHSGNQEGSSWRTIRASRYQIKVVLVASCFYVFQTLFYLFMANKVVQITFNDIPPWSPSYPGINATNGTSPFVHRELYDVGFANTPDWSHRPFLLKACFVDLMVTVAQFLVPLIILFRGQTAQFVNYTALVGILNICKGFVAIMTILPPARGGEKCWALNYPDDQMKVISEEPFSNWFYKSWGTVHGCNDMLWSGHTSQSCLGVLYLANWLRHSGCPFACRFLLAIYFAIYVWTIMAFRMHYTIDVFVAAMMATALYTHAPLRFWIWSFANDIVCNPPDKEDYDLQGLE